MIEKQLQLLITVEFNIKRKWKKTDSLTALF